jgi:hypothetical protein
MKRMVALLLFSLVLVFPLVGCGRATPPAPTAPPVKTETAAPTATESVTWQADGVISSGEYPHQANVGTITVYWRNDAQYLYIAVKGEAAGWLAFAIAPSGNMNSANFLIGTVAGDKTQVDDQFGNSYHSHTADVSLGGKNDVIASGGSFQNGITTWEAQIPLDSGDQYDVALKPGQTVSVIVASRSGSNPSSPHSYHAVGQITLD